MGKPPFAALLITVIVMKVTEICKSAHEQAGDAQ